MKTFVLAAGLAVFVTLAGGGEEQKPDEKCYPQGNPETAVASILEARAKKDYVYLIRWLLVPEESQRLIEKHGSLEKAAAALPEELAKLMPEPAVMQALVAPTPKEEGEPTKELRPAKKVQKHEGESKRGELKIKWVVYEMAGTQLQLDCPPAQERWMLNPPLSVPSLDPAGYPQGSAEEAMKSIIKAARANDVAYWVAWLITGEARESLLQKRRTFRNAVNDNASRKEKLVAQAEVMEFLLKENATEKGEMKRDGKAVQWVRYRFERAVQQFEKEPDGRWAMNSYIADIKTPVTGPKPEHPEAAPKDEPKEKK